MQFKAITPGVEVSGAAVLSVIEGMSRCSDLDLMESFRKMAIRMLTKHGIVEPQKDKWYLQQAWLDAFKEISEEIGPATLKMIGEKIPDTALWPSDIETIHEGLASIDVAYHMNHRGGEIGHYIYSSTGKKSGKMVCNNPYPCDFDLGIIKATARRFSPKGITAVVGHDDAGPCRKKGGESCTYRISLY
jgi:hypothetical protein